VNSSVPQTKIASYRPKRAALNWVDYLVIAATALTFLAVVAANNPHAARAQTRLSEVSAVISSTDLPEQVAQVASEPALIKARIGLKIGGM
jgi:hypothetical protein